MRHVIFTLALLAAPLGAGAQTPDLIFGGWSWRPPELGSRPAGLGGAYVALADSVRTTQSNPAGLALIPNSEFNLSTADLWAGGAISLHGAPSRTARADCGQRRARPFALALYGQQNVQQSTSLDVVTAPGRSQVGNLGSTTEEGGLSIAKGIVPWLDVGATFAWRHLRMDGHASEVDLRGDEQARLTIAGDSNKARLLAGLLATFGPAESPTAVRIGVAYE